uniref:Uncharacterized protein n=1 Tax=viral metagenome TaxID=1070528 RepID=A0A6H1ZKR9_9ZZZZ
MKKDVRKIMLENKYKTLHFLALERGDEVMAQEYLNKIDELNKSNLSKNNK